MENVLKENDGLIVVERRPRGFCAASRSGRGLNERESCPAIVHT